MEGIYEMDIKNNLISNQLAAQCSYCISDIPAWYRNSLTVFADDVLRIWSNSIFLQKEVTIGIEALIIGFLVSPYGIPMLGATVIAFLKGINEAIKSI